MLRIKFRYKDEYTRDNWSYQECVCSSVQKCLEWYGLRQCEQYEILEVLKA